MLFVSHHLLPPSPPGIGNDEKNLLDFTPDEPLAVSERAPRPIRTLRYSPLVQHFIKFHKFSSTNLVPKLRIALTEGEAHLNALDTKQSKLVEKGARARKCGARRSEISAFGAPGSGQFSFARARAPAARFPRNVFAPTPTNLDRARPTRPFPRPRASLSVAAEGDGQRWKGQGGCCS